MSDSQNVAPLSVEDVAEAWLDVQLTRVDGANAKAAARVLALVIPRLQRLTQERDAYADGSRKGAALAVMLNAYGLPDEPKTLARRIEQERATAEKQRVLLGTSLQGADATIKTLYARIAELEAALADRVRDTEPTPIPQTAPKTYFIQDTRQYVGNSVLWWRVDGHGYTCELSEAWEVDEAKARSIERTRDTDKAWPADVVRAAASVHVDIQKLRTPGDGHGG